jgi:TRAP transporter TAXI family solute receptor
VLRAHGTAVYKQEQGDWTAVAEAGYAPSAAPAYAGGREAGLGAILDAMRKVIESVQKQASPAQREVIEQELAAAHATIRSRLAHVENGYAIAAGPEHGQYLRFVQAVAESARVRVIPLVTRGGEENLRLLREGRVSLALAQGDAALAAFEGKGHFAEAGPYSTLRAVGSLYPEPLHVLVRADSPLASVEELRGRRVAIGQPGSASRQTALRALAAHGIESQDIQALELPPGDALVALEQGKADAVLLVIGVPADSVRDAMAVVPLRLLALSESAVSALSSGPDLFAFTISRGSYATQAQDVSTIATAALMLAGSDLSDIEVGAVARFVYEQGRDLAARGSAQGAQVSPATASQGLSVPMHTAAAKVLEELE